MGLQTDVRIRRRGAEAWGRSVNVSRGGMFVAAKHIIPRETEVEIEFLLGDAHERLSSTARVVWGRERSPHGPAGMGIQFLALGRANSRRIENFIYENAESISRPPASSRSSAA